MPAKILFMFTVICCTAVPFGCKQAGTEHAEHIVQTIPSIPAPAEIKNRAFEFAVLYAESETEYEWGGQDALRAIRLDCSGLVVMCYKYALVDTAYTLLFDDSTAHDMYQKYSIPTHAPQKGDLVFISGSLQKETWQDSNGIQKSNTYVLIEQIKTQSKKQGE